MTPRHHTTITFHSGAGRVVGVDVLHIDGQLLLHGVGLATIVDMTPRHHTTITFHSGAGRVVGVDVLHLGAQLLLHGVATATMVGMTPRHHAMWSRRAAHRRPAAP